MDDPHDAQPEQSPYVRLPWPLVAAGLVGVLILALAGGVLANRYLRPQLGVEPTPVLPAAALPPATTQPARTITATATPALRPTEASVPTPPILPTAATVTPTVSFPAVSPALPSASPISGPPTASAGTSSSPTVDSTLAHEVGSAYEEFWRVLSQALLELDATHISDVMDGDYLVNTRQLIDNLRAENRAIKTKVILNYSVVSATSEAADVIDDVEDNSTYVNIGTEDPVSGPTADQVRVLYRLKNLSGAWKVVDSVRSE